MDIFVIIAIIASIAVLIAMEIIMEKERKEYIEYLRKEGYTIVEFIRF